MVYKLSILISAGMGIGLVFWGVAEPISHYIDPPYGDARTPEAARLAVRYSFFHWGLQPWAIYTIISLSLAYFQYRKGYKGLISATFYPLLKEKVNGPIGKAIDILAIIATVFGVATSLGLGALQINGGLSHMFGISTSTYWQVLIIAIVTVLYLISATTGLDKGILLLSNGNLILAIGLLTVTFILGPTSFLLDTFTVSIGSYIQNLLQMSLQTASIITALPVGIIMALMCVSIYKALNQEVKMAKKQEMRRRKKIAQLIKDIAER